MSSDSEQIRRKERRMELIKDVVSVVLGVILVGFFLMVVGVGLSRLVRRG